MKRIPFNPDVCRSYRFRSLRPGSQALYLQAMLDCDSEGLIDRDTVLQTGSGTEENMQELIKNGYLIDMGDVLAVKHWFCHSPMKPGHRQDTVFADAREKLCVKSGVYYVK